MSMQNYITEKIVGKGSFGKALLVRRKRDNQKFIIKEIRMQNMDARAIKQNELEATLLSRLNHPNIVKFVESFREGRCLMICMEYADGGDLEGFLRNRRGRLMSENDVLHMFVQLVLAMKHVHDRKILHRDLKSQNVFLLNGEGGKPVVKLGDFGVSRVLDRTTDLAKTMCGTPIYMPPEIVNRGSYNSKCDVWCMGVILYELMALRLPFDGRSEQDLYNNIRNRSPPPVSSQHYSDNLRRVLAGMLNKVYSKRPSVNTILTQPLVVGHIDRYLSAMQKKCEFSHTILHGKNILKGPIGAAPEVSRPPNPPPSRPLDPAFAPPPRPPASDGNNPKTAAYYERQRQQQVEQAQELAKRRKEAEQRAEKINARAAQEQARKQAQALVDAQAKKRAAQEQQALIVAAQARAQVHQQREVLRREREAAAAKDRQRAEANAALRVKQQAEEKAIMLRRKAEREAFEAKQLAAKRLMQKRAADRERDIAAAADAIRQAKVDAHNKAVKDREEKAAVRAAALKKQERLERDNAKAARDAAQAVAKKALLQHIDARKADVVWPSAQAVVNVAAAAVPAPAPAPAASPHPSRPSSAAGLPIAPGRMNMADRVSAEARALNDRRKANLAKFESEILTRNRQKNLQAANREEASKARKAELLERRDLALMVKGLPINASEALRDNAKQGIIDKKLLPVTAEDPVQAGEGDPFWKPTPLSDDEVEEEAQLNEDSGSDFGVGEEEEEEESNTLAIDIDADLGSDCSDHDQEYDIQEDVDTDDDSATPYGRGRGRAAAASQAGQEDHKGDKSPAWFNNLEAQMAILQSDVEVLKASPRSNAGSNANTPRATPGVTPRRTPDSASSSSSRTPLAMRALGGGQGARQNVQAFLQNGQRPSSAAKARTPLGTAKALPQEAAAAARITPRSAEEHVMSAQERRAAQEKRQADLRAYVKAQREQRIKEIELEKDERPPAYSSKERTSSRESTPAATPERKMHSSKSAPVVGQAIINRNPTGRDYSQASAQNSQRSNQRKGDMVVALPAHEFNYHSEEAPVVPAAVVPRKVVKGALVVVEDTPGSMNRSIKDAKVASIASAARSRDSSARGGDADNMAIPKGNNPRSGHVGYRLAKAPVQDTGSNRARISSKPRVPSSVVPASPNDKSAGSRPVSAVSAASKEKPVALSLAEKKKGREAQRAAMHEAMRKQRSQAEKGGNKIEFDILIPEGESPYYNPGVGPAPVQHKKLVDVERTSATHTNLTLAGLNEQEQDPLEDTPPAYVPRSPELQQEEAALLASYEQFEKDVDGADVAKLGHGVAGLDPDATELDLEVLLQQMQDVVSKFHHRVGAREAEESANPELTHTGKLYLDGRTKAIRHLEGTMNIARQLALAQLNRSDGTTVTYDGSEGGGDPFPAEAVPTGEDDAILDDSLDTIEGSTDEDDDDMFGEEEEEAWRGLLREQDGDAEDELARTMGSYTDLDDSNALDGRDLGDYRPKTRVEEEGEGVVYEMSLDKLLEQDDSNLTEETIFVEDERVPSTQKLQQGQGQEQRQGQPEMGAMNAIVSKFEAQKQALEQLVNDQRLEAEADRAQALAKEEENLFSSDLEDDESDLIDSADDSAEEEREGEKLSHQEKFSLQVTPSKSPYRSRLSFGSAKKSPHNGHASGTSPDEEQAGVLGDTIDTLYSKFGSERVLKALGILRNSLAVEDLVLDGDELSPEEEEEARKKEDMLLTRLEAVLGPDGLAHLDDLFALCQSMEQGSLKL